MSRSRSNQRCSSSSRRQCSNSNCNRSIEVGVASCNGSIEVVVAS